MIKEEIVEIIDEKFEDLNELQEIMTEDVGYSEVPKNFYERYDLLEEHPFFINSFE